MTPAATPFWLLALVGCCLVSVSAQEVHEVTGETIDEFVGQHDLVLVEFYAPWCSTCKILEPELVQAAKLSDEAGLGVAFARANVNEDEALKNRFAVERTPTFKFVRKGSFEPFKMFRTGEAFHSKLHSMLRPDEEQQHPAKVFDDYQTLVRWLFWRGTDYGEIETTIVALFPVPDVEGCDALEEGEVLNGCEMVEGEEVQQLREAFKSLAVSHVDSFRFAVVESASIMTRLNLPTTRPALVMYTEHDEGKHVYKGKFQTDDIIHFIAKRNIPMALVVDHENLERVQARSPLLVHFFVPEAVTNDFQLRTSTLQTLAAVGADLDQWGLMERGTYTFALTNGEKYKEWMAAFGLAEGQLPAFAAIHRESGAMHTPSDEYENLVQEHAPGSGIEGRYSFNPSLLAKFLKDHGLHEATPEHEDL